MGIAVHSDEFEDGAVKQVLEGEFRDPEVAARQAPLRAGERPVRAR
jgi:hypothetical protein